MKSKKEAERLVAEILIRTTSAWRTVFLFRLMGQLGLPQATPQVALQHQQTTNAWATDEKHADMFAGDRHKLDERGFFKIITTAMTAYSVTVFESALDSASLIFAHAVLDSAVFDWCRVCALAEPDDLLHLVEQRRFSLSEIKKTSLTQLRDEAIDQYLTVLERESLIKKIDIIFSLCRPPPGFVGIRQYQYDRSRIVDLDNLRHDYVHRGGPEKRLPQGEDDLRYLQDTTNFLLPLVHQRYGVGLASDAVIASVRNRLSQAKPVRRHQTNTD